MLDRTDKTVVVEINGEKKTISIDRVKPAYLLQSVEPQLKSSVDIEKPHTARVVRFYGV